MSVDLRKAQNQDIEFLWYLRNEPDVYQYFIHPEPVKWEEHVSFVMQYFLGLRRGELYVIQYEGIPTGQIRLDYKNDAATISISLLKEFRGKGIASRAVELVYELLRRDGRVQRIIAEIHKDNPASIKLFEAAGFLLDGQVGDLLEFGRTV